MSPIDRPQRYSKYIVDDARACVFRRSSSFVCAASAVIPYTSHLSTYDNIIVLIPKYGLTKHAHIRHVHSLCNMSQIIACAIATHHVGHVSASIVVAVIVVVVLTSIVCANKRSMV